MRIGQKQGVVLLVVALLVVGGIVGGILATQGSGSGSSSSGPLKYPYPANAKKDLLSACTKRGSNSYCACVIRAYQNTIPYGTYQAILNGGIGATTSSLQRWQAFQSASSHCHL